MKALRRSVVLALAVVSAAGCDAHAPPKRADQERPSASANASAIVNGAPSASATAEKNKQQLDAGAFGYLSAATPGTVAGMSLALSKWGTKPLADLVAPAIKLAKGHKLGGHQAGVLAWSWEKIKKDPEARR